MIGSRGRRPIGTRQLLANVLLASASLAGVLLAMSIGVSAMTAARAAETTAASPPFSAIDAPRASLQLEFPWRAWRLFSSNDLLPQNTVYAIAQDRSGYV